jgi:hypothetical protein
MTKQLSLMTATFVIVCENSRTVFFAGGERAPPKNAIFDNV